MSEFSPFGMSPFGLTVAVLLAMGLLYLGRQAAHAAIRSLCRGLRDGLTSLSKAIGATHERLVHRNREILLELGRDATERLVEREFQRIDTVVARDLSGYPALHRKLSDQITRIDEDYRESTEAPPSPPEWVKAVETIAGIPNQGETMVGRVLTDIHKTLDDGHKAAMRDYRASSRERHRLLRKMLPVWRRLDQTLGKVDSTIRGLAERSQEIDRQMDRYQQIRAESDEAVRALSASTVTHFAASGLVLLIALMGGFINFHLIALPMSEMVGGSSYVGPIKTSDVAALVIILIEVAMGVFLMESLRITRLFPVIGTMDDRMRRRMAWCAFTILFVLASVEASLAYMRDLLAADRQALAQSLVGSEIVEAEFRWIPSVGQMVMGFMLPFALTFVAIPLESFIQSSRMVGGNLLAAMLRGLSGLCAVLASVFVPIGVTLAHVYDFLIVIPLRIEQMISRRRYDYDGEEGPTRLDQHTQEHPVVQEG